MTSTAKRAWAGAVDSTASTIFSTRLAIFSPVEYSVIYSVAAAVAAVERVPMSVPTSSLPWTKRQKV